jgi:hypothetical protein
VRCIASSAIVGEVWPAVTLIGDALADKGRLKCERALRDDSGGGAMTREGRPEPHRLFVPPHRDDRRIAPRLQKMWSYCCTVRRLAAYFRLTVDGVSAVP